MNSKFNFILDVDGVLTTGQFFYSKEGKVYKVFGPHDADGLKLIKNLCNIHFISADKRGFEITKKRIEDMGFCVDLIPESERLDYVQKKWGFERTIYMGDGIYDASIIKHCFFGIAPKSARKEALENAQFITPSNAGEGAVCDACLEIKRRFL